MANQPTDVNMSKQNIDMNQNTGDNSQSPNVTGAGETSRSANVDDIGNPKANTQDPHRARETGRADTDMNADSTDTMGGDLSSDS